MIITLLLFVHHIAEVVIGPAYQQSGKADAPAKPGFTDGGVTFSWGSLNRSDWDATLKPWEAAAAGNAATPGGSLRNLSGCFWFSTSHFLLSWVLLSQKGSHRAFLIAPSAYTGC